MSTQIRFYNPREASPELLEAMLVGREAIVQELLDDLSRQATSASRQHWLIRGPRGIGKTHLVGILYHRLRRDEKLAKRFLPIWLAETDAYSVYSAAVLLLQIAERLVEELRLSGDQKIRAIERQLAGLATWGDDPALFEEVCEILREAARSRGKILVVLMENLDALLAALPGQRGAQEVRRLRSLLSQDKDFLFVSTTPTRYLAAVSDPKQPLYGHLKERSLQSLTENEVGKLLQRLAEVTGQTEKLASLQEERDGRRRRRVLHRLTGGNPRAVVMAFTVLSGATGVQALVEEMSTLLDAQTAYFESRLAQLAPRERAIVGAMALAPKNLTLHEIASLSRLPSRSLSVQVDRLLDQGYLAITSKSGGKGTIYEVSDGLFRIWYQYRNGRKVLQPIVQFLALWYPDEELEQALRELKTIEASALALATREIPGLAALQILEALRYSRSEEGRSERHQLWAACEDERAATDKLEWDELEAFLDRLPVWKKAEENIRKSFRDLIKKALGDEEPLILFFIGLVSFVSGKKEQASATFRRIVKNTGGKTDEDSIVATTMAKIFSLLTSENEDPKAQLEALYGDLNEKHLLKSSPVAKTLAHGLRPALLMALGHLEEALEATSDALALPRQENIPEKASKSISHSARAVRAQSLAALGRLAEAEDAFRDWAITLSADPDAVPQDEMLRTLVGNFPPQAARNALEVLTKSQRRETCETAQLFMHVVDVLQAQEQIPGPGRKQSRRARTLLALAQVPPEIRETVKEVAEGIMRASRRKTVKPGRSDA